MGSFDLGQQCSPHVVGWCWYLVVHCGSALDWVCFASGYCINYLGWYYIISVLWIHGLDSQSVMIANVLFVTVSIVDCCFGCLYSHHCLGIVVVHNNVGSVIASSTLVVQLVACCLFLGTACQCKFDLW